MVFRSAIAGYCLCVAFFQLSGGAPSFTERRVSRDLNEIDGLRARLLRLQKQIQNLEAKENQNSGKGGREGEERNDVSAEADVSNLHRIAASEDRMMSPRQREVQTLAKGLSYDHDLHELAGALNQLTRQEMEKPSYADRGNSAGEYLGSRYNEAVPDRSEAGDVAEGEEADERRLRVIYNMLLKLYKQQNSDQIQVDARSSAASNVYPTEYVAPSEAREPVHIDEGSFGDFVDEVLSSIEAKLQRDVELANHAGLSVEDIIRDLKEKAEREKEQEVLETIEQQLQEFHRLRAAGQ